MKLSFKLATLYLAGLLSNCATLPDTRTATDDARAMELIERIQKALPGTYSNFAQINENGSDDPVTDLNIRQLSASGEPVFLFTSAERGADAERYDIYWLKLNPLTKKAEFHFARLTGAELSLSLQETLATAWQRVLPGCVIVLGANGEELRGYSRPDTCRFEDPYRGETRIYRMLALGANRLELETAVMVPGEQHNAGDGHLIMQKHRLYAGSASIGVDSDPATGEYVEWQELSGFSLFDDGRTVRLYGRNPLAMGFAAQLARLHRRAGEPPYLRLSIINETSGATQALQWIKPGSERIELNLEWLTIKLEIAPPGGASPPSPD